MLKPDILLDLFFKNLPIDQRIAKIAACGWRHVETWGGGDAAALAALGSACRKEDVELVSIVMNFNSDTAVAPIRAANLAAFSERIDRYSDQALGAGCTAGIVTAGDAVSGVDWYAQKNSMVAALHDAGEVAAKKGFRLNLEPLNTKVDHPGYYLDSREEGLDIIRQVGLDNVKLLYDLYHQQIMTGNHLAFVLAHLDGIGHFHAAGVPGRHELFIGEMDYRFVTQQINNAGYTGYFGLEYMPTLESAESLTRTLAYLQATTATV